MEFSLTKKEIFQCTNVNYFGLFLNFTLESLRFFSHFLEENEIKCIYFSFKRKSTKIRFNVRPLTLTLIYPAHFEDVPCQSGVNHIFEG